MHCALKVIRIKNYENYSKRCDFYESIILFPRDIRRVLLIKLNKQINKNDNK